MRRTGRVVLGVGVGVITAALPIPIGAQTVVPVHEEPHHRLVLDRPDLRVLDVQIPSGDTTLFHTHDAPIHYVVIRSSRTTSHSLGTEWPVAGPRPGGRDLPLGAGFWNLDYADDPLTHQVANIGSGPFRLIAVINRGAGSDPPAKPELAPGSLEAESRWFQRRRLTVPAGASVELPALSSPSLLIQVTGGAARLTDSTNRPSGSTSASGDWLLWERDIGYTLENASSELAGFVVVHVLP